MNDELKGVLEGLLFILGDEGASLDDIKLVLDVDEGQAREIINELKTDYESKNRGIQLSHLGNNYKLTTKPSHSKYYGKLIDNPNSHVLSQAALETLIIIAYNGPITRGNIEEIRGVNSDGIVRKLLARALIKETGKEDTPGRPALYEVTNEFLDHFNLSSLEELSELREFVVDEVMDDVDLFMSKYQEQEEEEESDSEE